MTRFHQDGIVRIQAERSAQSGIFLWLKDYDGKEHIVSLECEQEMWGIRDALVDAINGVQAKAAPTPDPVITHPRPSYHGRGASRLPDPPGMRAAHMLPLATLDALNGDDGGEAA